MTDKQKTGKYGPYILPILSISDLVLLNLIFLGITVFYHHYDFNTNVRASWFVCNVAYIPVIAWQFRNPRNRRDIIMDHVLLNALKAVAIQGLFFLACLDFIGLRMGTRFYLLFYSIAVVAMPLWWMCSRLIIKRLRHHGRNSISVVFVGTNLTSRRLAAQMTSDEGFGYKILGHFDDAIKDGFDGTYLGGVDDLDTFIRKHKVDEIYFTLSGEYAHYLPEVVRTADRNMCSFFYVPQISKYLSSRYELHSIGSMPVLSLRDTPLKNPLSRGIKRAFDITVSSAFLVVSPIIFVPVAVAIKLSSPGPVLFVQKRTGYRGREFNCFKFRTMRVNCDSDKAQATKHDPRKTRVGDFLRKTSLDELPQFINVFLGDMSIVGPRPHMLMHTDQYAQIISQYMVRHSVKPGITGWAQVNGYRGPTEKLWKMERRVEFDVWYIEHWNFFLDLKIMVRTVLNAVKGESNAF